MKKILAVISVGMLAYDAFDKVKRAVKEKNEINALSAAEQKIENLEKELSTVKRSHYDTGERRRRFKRR